MQFSGSRSVAGSERVPVPGSRRLAPAPPDERIEVTVVVRSQGSRLLAAAADIDRVSQFATEQGLEVLGADQVRRAVALAGPVAAMERAFHTSLWHYSSPRGSFRGRRGHLEVPESLGKIVEAIFGLDDRPQADPHFKPQWIAAHAGDQRARRRAYTPAELAQLYGFPRSDGRGQTVALIELGGGFERADLDAYFEGMGLKTPSVTAIGVDGAGNTPTGDPAGADGEVMLDIEVVGAAAPGAEIIVYFAPNSDRGFFDAITTAIHAEPAPSVVSISWGAAESRWTTQAMKQFDRAFADAGRRRVSVCCASGDAGSVDGAGDGLAHVDFPASSPHVLACGGTRIDARAGAITAEVVWNADGAASGGGVSEVFALPTWQRSAAVPPSANPDGKAGRGVPDVAANADPATGYRVRVDGREAVFGGTSAVAPLWAALIVRLNEQRGSRLGFLNPRLYGSRGRGAFSDIVVGTNGAYAARAGWDACTGLGSPLGGMLARALAEPAAIKSPLEVN